MVHVSCANFGVLQVTLNDVFKKIHFWILFIQPNCDDYKPAADNLISCENSCVSTMGEFEGKYLRDFSF